MAAKRKTITVQAETTDAEKETPVTNESTALVPADLPVVRSAGIRIGKNQKGAYATFTDGDHKIMGYVPVTDRSLEQLETVVVKGLVGFVKAGEALLEIRQRKLYEEAGHKSFVSYATERFNLSKARIYQLVDVAQVSAILVAAGEPLPRLTPVLEDLGRLKDDPQKLIETKQEMDEAAGGDASDLPRPERREAIAEAANENGKNLKADYSEEEGQDADDSEEEEETEDLDGAPDGDREEAPAARTSGTTNGTGTRASTGPRASIAPPTGPTTEEQALAELQQVVNGFKAGRYNYSYAKTGRAAQEIAGLALAYLAQEWVTVRNGTRDVPKGNVPISLVISKTTAKRMVAALKEAQDGEREKREGDDAKAQKAADAKTKKEEAEAKKTAAVAEADSKRKDVEALAKQGKVVQEGLDRVKQGEVIQPEDHALAAAYAIVDASQENKGLVTGTDLRRATEFLDAVTAQQNTETPEEEAQAEAPEAEADEEEIEVEDEEEADDADEFDLDEEEAEVAVK